MGFVYRYTSNSDGSQPQGPSTPDPTEVISFSYLAADQSYQIKIPGFERGRLTWLGTNQRFTMHSLSTSPSRSFGVSLYRPGAGNPETLPLDYTSFGLWHDAIYTPIPALPRSNNEGFFAYGVPTASGDVPASGSKTYMALAWGTTNIIGGNAFSGGEPGFIMGDVHLVFDFATGGLSGRLLPGLNDGTGAYIFLGEYPVTSVAYSVGSTAFSGKFAVPGAAADGFFEGFFTGPQATELMVRWQAPFLHPEFNAWGTMFGVWIGKASQ